MNEWDRDNLDFIMNSTSKEFEEWLLQADDDDINYALELIRTAKAELMVEEMEASDFIEDTAVAKSILDKFRGKK